MRWILLLAALGSSAEWAAAQSAPLVSPGSRVRLRMLTPSGAPTRLFDGTVETVTGDTLTMRSRMGGNPELYVPAANVQLFVLTGHRSGIARGGAIGSMIGILGGGLWSLLRQEECTGNKSLCINRKPLAVKEGGVLILSGAVIGMVFGAFDRREVWTRAWMTEATTPQVSVGRHGANLGFSFAF